MLQKVLNDYAGLHTATSMEREKQSFYAVCSNLVFPLDFILFSSTDTRGKKKKKGKDSRLIAREHTFLPTILP